jgi:hypothetical protein
MRDTMNDGLKVWHNGEDWVVAVSAERAKAHLLEIGGYHEDEVDDFREWPADKPLTLAVEGDEGIEKKTLLPAEWIAECGNRETHLGSVNW